ncbi:hypothetical protein XBO1_380001 [Xenorhabdus bovienii str. oregonense]|uniref:SF4 helicase domain-containing protein n=1 Tax=Xenorhabdus bovienii str. oregonense TaxID=1398202 RepID=A0A077PA07_XENBV|nr:hypothetical protein XBO1_380001 [Xenorhabdus bovienii str. oregonense]
MAKVDIYCRYCLKSEKVKGHGKGNGGHPDTPDTGIAEIIIGKQRQGPTGVVRVRFDGQYTRFSDLSADSDGYGEVNDGTATSQYGQCPVTTRAPDRGDTQ